jgi:hypothetical protein
MVVELHYQPVDEVALLASPAAAQMGFINGLLIRASIGGEFAVSQAGSAFRRQVSCPAGAQ